MASSGSSGPGSGRPRASGRALYGGLPEPGPPGFAPRLLELADELRSEGLAVGTSELLDAFSALGELSWTEQEDFREALAATLAKSQEDRRVFELVFDRFFFRAAERDRGVRAPGRGLRSDRGRRAAHPARARPQGRGRRARAAGPRQRPAGAA